MERDPADLIEAYFSGELDETGTLDLRQWLRADPNHLTLFAFESRLESALKQVYQARRLQGAFDTADLLDELVRDAEAHPIELIDVTEQQMQLEQKRREETLALEANLSLENRTHMHVIIPKWGIYVGIAAALVLATLIFWPGKEHPSVTPLAGNSSGLQEPGPDPITDPTDAAWVATLTNTQEAQWVDESIAIGEELRAGERLMLTHGFAEITTNRGAVAILEAPATIELTDHDNTLYLHNGKLVGLCYTESSKGFLVKTDHAEIMDVGTEFGVAVDPQRGTEVQVLSGSVLLEPVRESSPFEPVSANAGDAFWVQDAVAPEPVTARPTVFYRALPFAYERLIRADEPAVYWRFDALSDRGQLPCVGRDFMSLAGIDRSDLVANPAPISGAGRSLWLTDQERNPITCDRPIDLDYSSGLTVEAWVWLPTGTDRRMRVVSNAEADSIGHPVNGFALGVAGLSDYPISVDGPPLMFTAYGIFSAVSKESIPTDRWVHVAVSLDGQGTLKLIIDGAEVAHHINEDTRRHKMPGYQGIKRPLPSKEPMLVGSSINEKQWVGGIDEVAIYNRALSLDEISARAQRSGELP